MILVQLQKAGKISCPSWLSHNTQYLALMGSVAYGASSDTSDIDLYGFAIPPREMVFPHLTGEVLGFGRQAKRFDVWQQHHIAAVAENGSAHNYDFAVYSIVRYFHLAMENNPNLLDSIYVPLNCVLHSTYVGEMVRQNRSIFLHKGSYNKFLGYAYSMLHKASTKEHKGLPEVQAFEQAHGLNRETTLEDIENAIKERELDAKSMSSSKKIAEHGNRLSDDELLEYHGLYKRMIESSRRAEKVKQQGMDTKFLYHLVRLSDECDQILTTGDLNLQRAKEHMKAVRRGEVSEKELRDWFSERERSLEKAYNNSKLPHTPDEVKIKALLLQCLEHHYGSLDKLGYVNPSAATDALRAISEIAERVLRSSSEKLPEPAD